MMLSLQQKVTDKYLNATYMTGTPNVTGFLVHVTQPAQGTTNGQREGDSLCLDKIQMRCFLSNPETAIGTNNVDAIRIVVVQARASTALTLSSSAAPTTGIFDLGYSGALDSSSFINENAKGKLFNVLYDRVHTCCFGSSNGVKFFELNLKPKIKTINFTPTTTTEETGGLYLAFFSLLGNAICDVAGRLIYHDL
jgi:hypothetical protein